MPKSTLRAFHDRRTGDAFAASIARRYFPSLSTEGVRSILFRIRPATEAVRFVVLAGMLGVTFFGIFLTLIFYFVLQTISEWWSPHVPHRVAATQETNHTSDATNPTTTRTDSDSGRGE